MNVMLGFKGFRSAAVTLSGIELMHRIRKGQFDLTSTHLKDATSPLIWMAVLPVSLGIRNIGEFSPTYRVCTTTDFFISRFTSGKYQLRFYSCPLSATKPRIFAVPASFW
ncbi:hypothetical protein FVF58_49815 [Paraburkholderia panacisoli]|uniref:Uncharacterized protein n=1 Tax=Paraburkholderia panacisoli TaxID=2603818 RepID=A0A5B0G1B5_9BURK|nr:hypothetical protein FVF58_49815 [Paraburkholderia panacisoli]